MICLIATIIVFQGLNNFGATKDFNRKLATVPNLAQLVSANSKRTS